jgi:hypothetical protein
VQKQPSNIYFKSVKTILFLDPALLHRSLGEREYPMDASFFQDRRVFFSEEKKQKTFIFMRQLDRAFPLRGVFSSG